MHTCVCFQRPKMSSFFSEHSFFPRGMSIYFDLFNITSRNVHVEIIAFNLHWKNIMFKRPHWCQILRWIVIDFLLHMTKRESWSQRFPCVFSGQPDDDLHVAFECSNIRGIFKFAILFSDTHANDVKYFPVSHSIRAFWVGFPGAPVSCKPLHASLRFVFPLQLRCLFIHVHKRCWVALFRFDLNHTFCGDMPRNYVYKKTILSSSTEELGIVVPGTSVKHKCVRSRVKMLYKWVSSPFALAWQAFWFPAWWISHSFATTCALGPFLAWPTLKATASQPEALREENARGTVQCFRQATVQ